MLLLLSNENNTWFNKVWYRRETFKKNQFKYYTNGGREISMVNPQVLVTAQKENIQFNDSLCQCYGKIHSKEECTQKRQRFFNKVEKELYRQYEIGNILTLEETQALINQAYSKIMGAL